MNPLFCQSVTYLVLITVLNCLRCLIHRLDDALLEQIFSRSCFETR